MWLQRLKLNWYDDRATKALAQSGAYDPAWPVSRILDLGAHKGFVTEHYARKYPNAVIHAYEPNSALFTKLKARTARYRNVHACNEAIADHEGMVDFFISERHVSSSLFGRGAKQAVSCVTLAQAVERIGSPVFVKIDIEGAEYDALAKIPAGITGIVGEAHPQKANRSNEELRASLRGVFKDVEVGEGKSIFRAR